MHVPTRRFHVPPKQPRGRSGAIFIRKLKKIMPRVPADLRKGKKASEQLRLKQQHAERLAKLQAAESACSKRRRSMPERIHDVAQKNLKSHIPDTPSSDSKQLPSGRVAAGSSHSSSFFCAKVYGVT
ncbi:MAG: hypothetical protein FRX49_12173 [Trebouxia sp. A1-2]|nr:MAG: hypothetical protein FRX49_12173 [Trebouxia sp. A1-2]